MWNWTEQSGVAVLMQHRVASRTCFALWGCICIALQLASPCDATISTPSANAARCLPSNAIPYTSVMFHPMTNNSIFARMAKYNGTGLGLTCRKLSHIEHRKKTAQYTCRSTLRGSADISTEIARTGRTRRTTQLSPSSQTGDPVRHRGTPHTNTRDCSAPRRLGG